MKKIEIRPKGEGVRMVVTSLFSYFKNEPDIMTVPEAAKALRCGKNTIYDLIKEGGMEIITDNLSTLLIGNVVAFIVALLAIKFFIGFVTKYGFKAFGWYRILVGGLILGLILCGHNLTIV